MDYIKKIDEVNTFIKKKLKNKRYEHVLRVAEEARRLAEIYGEDKNKATLAAMLHDCAKGWEFEALNEVDISDIIKKSDIETYFPIVHAFIASELCKKKFDIKDEYIINAVKYHTTGRPQMTLLDKIIYVADSVEPGRDYEGLEKYRKMAQSDLDRVIFDNSNVQILLGINNNYPIHPLTVLTRNFYLKKEE